MKKESKTNSSPIKSTPRKGIQEHRQTLLTQTKNSENKTGDELFIPVIIHEEEIFKSSMAESLFTRNGGERAEQGFSKKKR